MKNIFSYTKDQNIWSNEFQIGECTGYLSIYPRGREGDTEKTCRVFLALRIGDDVLDHSVRFSINDGHSWRTKIRSVSFFRGMDVGFCIHWKQIKKNPVIPFRVVFEKEMMISRTRQRNIIMFESRLEQIHKLSMESGDITLVLNQETSLGPPPTKKRKRNSRSSSFTTNQEIKIVGAILRSASPVFDGMLQSKMKEQKEKRIEIPAKSIKDIEDLAYFINTNKLSTKANPRALAPLAHLYQMTELFWQCINMAVNQLDVDNFVQTVQLFNKYEIEERFQTVIQFGKDNVKKLKARSDFQELSHSFKFMLAAAEK